MTIMHPNVLYDVKVKLSWSTLVMHIRGEELECHLFLTSVLYSGEWSLHTLAVFRPGRLYKKLSGPQSQSGCF